MGGSLWQYDTKVPMTLDRFVPSGMTAMELIEEIALQFNLLLVPDNNGIMHLQPRSLPTAVINLTLPQVSISQTLSWPDFASIIRVSSSDSNWYSDSFGQQGGAYMEVSSMPLISSKSGCTAMSQTLVSWFGQPRQLTEYTVQWPDADSPAPWEAVPLFSRITITDSVTGETSAPQRLMGLSQNYITGTAKLTCVGA